MAVTREEIIEALKEMSLLEASELVKDIEETFGVSAAAPVAVAAAAAAPVEEAPTTKVCPFCKSEIAIEATRCPHCTSQLEG